MLQTRFFAALVFGALLIATIANADTTVPVDFHFAGYMRSGTGDNDKGGKQVCFNNPGSVANEFRLGNECGTYGEASFQAVFLKPQNPDDMFFRSQLTLAYFPPNDSQYEDTTVSGDHDINVVEAYVIGGNIGDFKGEVWAGKRFYRMIDTHMNDFYYFDNLNGTGAGVEKVRLPFGFLNVAVLRESTFAQPGLPPSGLAEPTQARVDSTSAGVLGKTALDTRYDMPLSDTWRLSIWGVAAYSPPGNGTNINPTPTTVTPTSPAPATATYEAGRGYVAGVYTRETLNDKGDFNDMSIAYATGIMQTMEMGNGYGSRGPAGVIDGSGGNNANRIRFVDSLNQTFGDRWAALASVTYEDRNSGATVDAHSTWWDVGIRPYYTVSEHFSLVAEVGHSEVRDQADRDVSGNHIAARQMTRVTFAPQIAIKSGVFARPVLRAFVTQTLWNDANQKFVNNGQTESISPTPAYASQTSGTSMGVQAEVWF